MKQALAQFILDGILSTPGKSFASKLKRRALFLGRRGLLRSDPLVRYHLGAFDLWLPMSHSLPYHKLRRPEYSMNIGRISERVKDKYADLRFIDIGANVGDTVAIIRSRSHFPVLCIEGDPGFFEILEMNARVLGPDIELAKCFVGRDATLTASLRRVGGTGRIEQGHEGTIRTQPLTSILEGHKEFRRSKLLKIDTDGFDVEILRTSVEWISEAKPVLFFEYDPYLLEKSGTENPTAIFRELWNAGYRSAIVYENYGDYLTTLPLHQAGLMEDVHNYFRRRDGARYVDICAFHHADEDLCGHVRQCEMEHFRQRRG